MGKLAEGAGGKMTRQEYDQKREAGANAGFTEIATYINDSMIKDEYIESLEARISELEAALDKAAHQLYDYSGSCPSDLYDWEHPNTCIRECDRYDNPDEAWKCWRLWLMCPAPPEE